RHDGSGDSPAPAAAGASPTPAAPGNSTGCAPAVAPAPDRRRLIRRPPGAPGRDPGPDGRRAGPAPLQTALPLLRQTRAPARTRAGPPQPLPGRGSTAVSAPCSKQNSAPPGG